LHKKFGGSSAVNAKIGERTGTNFETAKNYRNVRLGIPHEKYNQKNLKHLAVLKKITGINTRTNQEQRDALMLIWGR
jgi:hypothetical protein